MKFEGYIFTPKPFYGTLSSKKDRIASIKAIRRPKKITKLILPGFISTHIHTIQTHARNTAENMELLEWLSKVIWPFEAKLTKKTAYYSALCGMDESLSKGITSILDMATARHTDSVFEAARNCGIRAFIGKALMDQGPKNLIEPHPLEEIFDHLDKWHQKENGRLQVTLCPRFVLSCSEKLLRSVGELSKKYRLLHHTHASENKAECEWIEKRYKKSNIEILEKFGCLNEWTTIAHGVHFSDRDIALLRKRKVSISHCPTSNLKLASGLADLKRLASLNLSLGVDGAPCNNLLDPFFEMRLTHLLNRYLHGLYGFSAERVFKMATMGGAKALHQEKEIGSLEIGKKADFLVIQVPDFVQFNPDFPYESLIHSITSADIHSVFVDGHQRA
ncbi:MAG: amidohydrolase family protein [Deltaproteobacteria bacterium]|nr:amidohydrolase family protein [Deltaproteobacteria bacterium]